MGARSSLLVPIIIVKCINKEASKFILLVGWMDEWLRLYQSILKCKEINCIPANQISWLNITKISISLSPFLSLFHIHTYKKKKFR